MEYWIKPKYIRINDSLFYINYTAPIIQCILGHIHVYRNIYCTWHCYNIFKFLLTVSCWPREDISEWNTKCVSQSSFFFFQTVYYFTLIKPLVLQQNIIAVIQCTKHILHHVAFNHKDVINQTMRTFTHTRARTHTHTHTHTLKCSIWHGLSLHIH